MTTIANPSAGGPIVRTARGVPNTTMATLPHGGRRIVIIKIGRFADLYCVARGRVEAYRAGPRLSAWFDALEANDLFAEGLTFQIDRQTWQLGERRKAPCCARQAGCGASLRS